MPRGPVRHVMPKGGVVFRMKPGAKNIGYGKGPVQNKGGQTGKQVGSWQQQGGFGPGKQQGGLGPQQGGFGRCKQQGDFGQQQGGLGPCKQQGGIGPGKQ